MKIILDITKIGKKGLLIFEEIDHSEALRIIDDLLPKCNNRFFSEKDKLRYSYIPGPLTLQGSELILRNFCGMNDFTINETKNCWPPMPHN